MNKINNLLGKNKKVLVALTAASTVAIVTSIAQTSGETGQQIYVNGTKIENTKVYISGGQTFVPAEDFARAAGDEVTSTMNSLTITHNGDSYYFSSGQNVYRVNGNPINMSVEEKNGVKVPSGAKSKAINHKVYVPINVLVNVLGYDVHEDTQTIWFGEKPSVSIESSSNSTNSSNTVGNITENMKKSLDDGWVVPQLPDNIRSTDDLLADSQALQKYLEFEQNGLTPTSAKFNPFNNGFDYSTAAVGPIYSGEFTSIYFQGYYFPDSDAYMKKVNYINPQVLKFYFPTSWQWINDKYIDGGDLSGSRIRIDGRDTFFSSGSSSQTIHISKVGGELGNDIPNLPNSISTVIGTEYTVKQGDWVQSNSGWMFKNNDGTYATGWLNNSGSWYYFNAQGIMQTGWINDGANWYYCWGSGQMASNTTISGYTLAENGQML